MKADLDSTTFAYDCRMQFLARALLASCKKLYTTIIIQRCLYLQLSYVIFCDIHDSRKRVIGLIYMKHFMSLSCRKLVACDKVVLCKSP